MRLRSTLRAVGLAALAAGMVVAAATDADAERQRWKLASSYGQNLDVFGETIKRPLATIQTASDGSLKIQFFEPGALVHALTVFVAVSTGAVAAPLPPQVGQPQGRGRGGLPGVVQRGSRG